MSNSNRFSQRHGLGRPEPEVTVRTDAPANFRSVLVDLAYEAGLDPNRLRTLVCKLLRVPADPSNWSPFPNIDGEVRDDVQRCEWFEVYDIVEKIHSTLSREYSVLSRIDGDAGADHFERELNRYFRSHGFGWQLRDGLVEIRGPEGFEVALSSARANLAAAHRETAEREIHQALHDLSSRPTPDLTGAIQHSVAALECVARDLVGNPKATLGDILKRGNLALTPPLDKAVEKLWGYASEQGRHLREGTELSQEEVELVVHVAAAVTSYLSKGSK